MNRIVVQESFTISKAIFMSLLFAGIGVLFVLYYMTISFLCGISLFCIFFALLVLIFIHCTFNQRDIVSELVLTDEYLIIVHKKNNKISKHQKININDIKSIHATLQADEYIERIQCTPRYYVSRNCTTSVNIDLRIGDTISFEQYGGSWSWCTYSFMFRLITFAKQLPNFTYEVKGNWILPKRELEYFSKYGKRLHYAERVAISQKYMQIK